MKTKLLLIFFLFLWTVSLSAQTYPEKTVQQVAIGPHAGYDASAESVVYGVNALYELRPFRRWGFTVAATYDKTPYASHDPLSGISDFDKRVLGTSEYMEELKLKQSQIALTGGARFYIKRFFIAAGAGWSWIDFTLRGEESGDQESGQPQRFYHYYGAGYQLPLNGKQQLEFFLNGTTGGVPKDYGTARVVAGIRYGHIWSAGHR